MINYNNIISESPHKVDRNSIRVSHEKINMLDVPLTIDVVLVTPLDAITSQRSSEVQNTTSDSIERVQY
jgi:hypothetical protein